MAKKTKRKVSAAPTNVPAVGNEVRPVIARSTVTTLRNPASEFNPDYTYVVNDLKRIAVLAGGAVALLIVLSFIL